MTGGLLGGRILSTGTAPWYVWVVLGVLAHFPGSLAQGSSQELWGGPCGSQAGFARLRCIAHALAQRVYTPQDVTPVLCEADRLVASKVVPDCQLIAQAVGVQLYNDVLPDEELKPDNVPTVLAHGMTRGTFGPPERAAMRGMRACDDSLCKQGCTHGVALAFTTHMFYKHKADSRREPPGQNKAFMGAVVHMCQRSPKGSDALDCMQGIGHGLLRNGAVSLSAATQACEAGGLLAGSGFTAACKHGAVLEFLQSAPHLAFDGTPGDVEAVRRLIHSLPVDPFLEMDVAGRLGGVLMVATGHDERRSLALCRQLLVTDGRGRRERQQASKCADAARIEWRRMTATSTRLVGPATCKYNPTTLDWMALPPEKPTYHPAARLQRPPAHGGDGGADDAAVAGVVPRGCMVVTKGEEGGRRPSRRRTTKLPFCGDAVPYPITRPARRGALFKLDQELSYSFRALVAQIPHLSTPCRQSLRAEWCKAMFPLCTGKDEVAPYCDYSQAHLPPGRMAVCRDEGDDHRDVKGPAVVCGSTPLGEICVRAHYCKNVIATGHAGIVAAHGKGCQVKPNKGKCFYSRWARLGGLGAGEGGQQFFLQGEEGEDYGETVPEVGDDSGRNGRLVFESGAPPRQMD